MRGLLRKRPVRFGGGSGVVVDGSAEDARAAALEDARRELLAAEPQAGEGVGGAEEGR